MFLVKGTKKSAAICCHRRRCCFVVVVFIFALSLRSSLVDREQLFLPEFCLSRALFFLFFCVYSFLVSLWYYRLCVLLVHYFGQFDRGGREALERERRFPCDICISMSVIRSQQPASLHPYYHEPRRRIACWSLGGSMGGGRAVGRRGGGVLTFFSEAFGVVVPPRCCTTSIELK